MLIRDDSDESATKRLSQSKRRCCRSCPKRKCCCQRNFKQWLVLIIYYIIYAVLILALLFGFLYAIKIFIQRNYPKSPPIDKETLLDLTEPALAFFPNILVTKFPIIWYSKSHHEKVNEKHYVKFLDKELGKYKNIDQTHYRNCSNNEKRQIGTKPCFFDIQELRDCAQNDYQYSQSSLCFFLKLNRVKNWTPDYFKDTKDFSNHLLETKKETVIKFANEGVIYVDCNGKNIWANQFMGPMNYYPQQGFRGSFFPYHGEHDYLPPLVAVKLNNITSGTMIHIQCFIWVKNINDPLNHVTMKIFLDEYD